jgi:hypothetical protein
MIVDADSAGAPDGCGGSEGEVRQRLDDLAHGLLEGGVAVGAGHLAALAGPFFLGGRDRPIAVGGPQERDETADEEANLRFTTEQRLPQPVPLRRPAPAGRDAFLLLEYPGLGQPFEVSAHRRRMDTQHAGELRDLTRPFLQRLDDGQSARVTQEAVALRAYPMKMFLHWSGLYPKSAVGLRT